MKCIKAIKSTKQVDIGDVKKVHDYEVHSMVTSGYWGYTTKTEYKKYMGSIEPTEAQVVENNSTNKVLPSKKQRSKKH